MTYIAKKTVFNNTASTCSTCPHFNNYDEPSKRGWCQLFNHLARTHHIRTNDCINSSESIISHELEDNLALFPGVNFEELEAFPTEETIDEAIAYGNSPAKLSAREARAPHAEYQVGSIVKVIDPDEDYTEWAVFEVLECMHNQNLYDNIETYLYQSQCYYRLCSYTDGNTMPSVDFALDKSLWVRENEICHFDMAHLICTHEVF